MNLSETKLFVYGIYRLFNDNFDQRSIVFKIDNMHLIANFFNEVVGTNGVFINAADELKFRKAFCKKFKIDSVDSENRAYYQNNLEEFFTILEEFVKNELSDIIVSPSTISNVNFLESGLNFPNFYRFGENVSFIPVTILNSEKQE
jgi:uncharacterized protein YggL (DUF469 family)